MPNRRVSIRAGAGVYRHFRNLDLKPWQCIGELVDNSLGSFENKKVKKALKKIYKNPILEVEIHRDIKNNTLIIKDNAGGISEKDLDRALEIGVPPDDATGMNEFGVGMKMASFWFAKRWRIVTKALGERNEKEIIFDVDEIERDQLDEVEVVPTINLSKDISYTHIYLEKIYPDHFPSAGQTLLKIKDHLSSMYRRQLTNGSMNLIWIENDSEEKLVYDYPQILNMQYVGEDLSAKGQNEEWKREVNFKYKDKSVTGWVGLMDKTSSVKYGFSLFRRGRVIEGQENNWRPDINESLDKRYVIFSGNSEPKGRLFGELDFKGFEVSNNKSSIDWGNDDEGIKFELIKYLVNLIKLDEDGERRRFWKQLYAYLNARAAQKTPKPPPKSDSKDHDEKLDDFYAETSKDVFLNIERNYQEAATQDNYDKPVDLNALIDDQNSKFPPREFQVNVSGEDWLVKTVPISNDGESDFFSFNDEQTDKYPKEVTIAWDKDHAYAQKIFKDIESFQSNAEHVFVVLAATAILEIESRDDNRNINPSEYRNLLNKTFKNTL